MNRIIELVRPYWKRLLLAALSSVIVSALNGSFAWLVKPAVDNIFVSGRAPFVALISLAVFTVFFLRGIFEYLQNYLMKSVGSKIVRDLRNSLYRHMLYLPMNYHGGHGGDTTGVMLSRVINDTQMLQELLAYRIRDLFVSAGTLVILAGVAFYRRWDLTLIALTVLPLTLYAVGSLGRRLKKVSERAQAKMASMMETLTESLSGIRIVKSFLAEEKEARRFGDKAQDHYRELMRSARIQEATGMVMEIMAGGAAAFIIFYGGRLVSSSVITAGDFFSFLAAILMMFTPAKRLAQVNNGLQQAKAFIGRADEVLLTPREPDGASVLGEFRDSIEFRDVSFRYPGREENALDGVNLKIGKGEMVAIAGGSGSGKTTLVDLISRFYRPLSGSILIDGVDINTVTTGSLRAQVGIVSQDIILFNDSVRANIAYGMPAAPDFSAIEKAAVSAHAHEFISRLPQGYETPIGEGGSLLSGGQKQRISIARAMLKNPPLLILDEATSSLDTQSELMVQEALDDLIAEARKGIKEGAGPMTVIIIAHRLSTIKRADRIVVLDMGRIAEAGTHEELIKAGGLYSRFYGLQGVTDPGVKGVTDPDVTKEASSQ